MQRTFSGWNQKKAAVAEVTEITRMKNPYAIAGSETLGLFAKTRESL